MTPRKEVIGNCEIVEDVTDLAAGVAGEHLVCADLLLRGYNAFLTDQNCPYDVAVEMCRNLYRIQVKTTRKPRPIPQRVKHTPAYLFHVRKCGKGGRRQYDERDIDALALVALDIRAIAYIKLSEAKQTIYLNRKNLKALWDIHRVIGLPIKTPRLFEEPAPKPKQEALL